MKGGVEDGLAAEYVFDKLHNAEHPIPRKNRGPLQLKHVLASGGKTALLNIDKATTPAFVETVVKDVLGPHCSVERVTRSTQHESFVPVKGKATEMKLSTTEREAKTIMAAGDDPFARFILVDATHKAVYSYNNQGRLERGNPKPRGARIDVGSASDTAQVRFRILTAVDVHDGS